MPQLEPNQFTPQNVISFNERKGISNPEKYWVDFFIDDYHYENFWINPISSLVNMKKFAGIITTDYSMLCFDGLPENSSIAISSNGCLSTPYGKKILLTGVDELQKQKSPFKIIICGCSPSELEKYDNVICYPSFSQRMQERIKKRPERLANC